MVPVIDNTIYHQLSVWKILKNMKNEQCLHLNGKKISKMNPENMVLLWSYSLDFICILETTSKCSYLVLQYIFLSFNNKSQNYKVDDSIIL